MQLHTLQNRATEVVSISLHGKTQFMVNTQSARCRTCSDTYCMSMSCLDWHDERSLCRGRSDGDQDVLKSLSHRCFSSSNINIIKDRKTDFYKEMKERKLPHFRGRRGGMRGQREKRMRENDMKRQHRLKLVHK